ncbi:MAG: restriction endonuclease subunit S [Polyangiaceae bacterium]|nr:restriction endonuclease subunit S [Polyangiaceae bacterium]
MPPRVEESIDGSFGVKKFVENFGVIVEAVGGVERIRDAIRDLAIVGKLTGTFAEREDCLPRGWMWATPDELCAPHRHALAIGPFGSNLLKEDYTDSGVPLVFVRDITSRSFGGERTRYVTPKKAADLGAHRVEPGDLLITKMGSPPGDTAIYPATRPPAIITADCIKLTPNTTITCSEFLEIVVRAGSVREKLLEITMGVAHQKVSLKRFRVVKFPLPPLAEQKRIVARVDQLMALIDDLEAKQTKKRKLSTRFTKASLEALTTAESPEEFDTAWQRVVENFPTVADSSDKVSALRRCVRTLAVQGLLKTQSAHDEPAKELLQRLATSKKTPASSAEAIAGLDRPLPPLWSWARFDEVAVIASNLVLIQKRQELENKAVLDG